MNLKLHFRAAAVAILICAMQPAAQAAPGYSVKDIGTVDNTYGLKPASMNDKSWVTGHGEVPPSGESRAFITGPGGKNRRSLGDRLTAYAINNHGAVAGTMQDANGNTRAFTSGKQGSNPHEIGTLGGLNSSAMAVNNHGVVVGYSETRPDSSNIRAFVYDGNTGKMTSLGNCPVDASNAMAVNDKGMIAGSYFCEETDAIRVFTASPPDYGLVPYTSPGSLNLRVTAISPKGTVLGTSTVANGLIRLFTIRPGKQIELLNTPQELMAVFANALNDAGTIVGTFEPPNSWDLHAFVCSGDCSDFVDLNSVATAPPGVVFAQAASVNASGQILATGSDGHGYLLTPKK
ncbi:MAG TPA: DUF3466 family protein [Ideonella sp.]|uniref:DUF3466 family protein n=1 Tax=Ideonella sp. TaxID=1929293 RepID=UPI002B852A14|nr:DUF3466 family protein [Ideonella sp.]HSI51367.1 DUF3466 family protein [Ideonella sp.]